MRDEEKEADDDVNKNLTADFCALCQPNHPDLSALSNSPSATIITIMKNKKKLLGSTMDVVQLAYHLRQEHLFIHSEKSLIQKLNSKVSICSDTEKSTYHLCVRRFF